MRQEFVFTFELPEINDIAKDFLKLCENHFFFAFYGTLGVGKTTFIKSICRALGCEDNVTSPTYSLVNEYHTNLNTTAKKFTIYHMDLYRLENTDQALEIGIEEYMNRHNAYCFVEWPELIENILPENGVKVYMETGNQNNRILRIFKS